MAVNYEGAYGSFPPATPNPNYTTVPNPAYTGATGQTAGVNAGSGSAQNAWKAPILNTFQQGRQAAIIPGVGVDPVLMAQARDAKQQAIMAAKQSMMPQGFSGDPNSLIPRGTTSGGVNQYYNPATGGMFVGNPFRNTNNLNQLYGGASGGSAQGMTGLLGQAPAGQIW